jgi:pyruvate/2-oxoglutarate/acetoin dehydrogenase E1 component
MNQNQERILSYPDAIHEALFQEMERDPDVVVMGQGVDDPKRILGTTIGLLERFGSSRVFDTPIAEDGMVGAAIGMALAGLRPVHVHIRMDFLLLAMNQLINMAAKTSYMYGGQSSVPIVIRSLIGKSWGQGPQHSQSLYPLFMNIPGLKIVCPSTPYDAKGCLISAIRDNNPVIFIEHRLLYYQKGYVPQNFESLPLGKARILNKGKDITLVGISKMAIECLRAQKILETEGIHAEVIDPISLYPIDLITIENSVLKTGKLIVVDNAWITCAAGSEIISSLCEKYWDRGFQMQRMGFAFVPCPTTPSLEQEFYPNAKKIASKAYELLLGKAKQSWPDIPGVIEEVEFKGPF